MATEREKEPVQIENPFTNKISSRTYWYEIYSHIGTPTDEIERKIVQLSFKLWSGRYSLRTDFQVQNYLGWRHFNRINSIIPPSEKDRYGKKISEYIFLDDPFERILDNKLNTIISAAGEKRNESWSIDDHIYYSTKDLGNPHSTAPYCARMIWSHKQHRWTGVWYDLGYNNKEDVTLSYWRRSNIWLGDEELARHIRYRWLLTDPGEIVDPIHTPPQSLDHLLREFTKVEPKVIRERLLVNRARYYEGNPKHKAKEFNSNYFGILEEAVY